MYFRSQDKEFLGEVKKIVCVLNGSNQILGYDTFEDDSYVILGTYNSKERVIEVLDEIQKNIVYGSAMSKFCTNIKGLPRDGALLEGIIENLLGTAAVYTMPQE